MRKTKSTNMLKSLCKASTMLHMIMLCTLLFLIGCETHDFSLENTPPTAQERPQENLPTPTNTDESPITAATATEEFVLPTPLPTLSGIHTRLDIYSVDFFVEDIAWSPSGEAIVLAGGDDERNGLLFAVSVETREVIFEVITAEYIAEVEWPTDNKIAFAANASRELMLLNLNGLQITPIDTNVTILTLKANNRNLLAIGGGGGIEILDSISEVIIFEIMVEDNNVLNVAWSNDSETLAYTTGEAVLIWEMQEEQASELIFPETAQSYYQFINWSSENDEIIVSGAFTNFLAKINVSSGTLNKLDTLAYDIELSSDEMTLATRYLENSNALVIYAFPELEYIATLAFDVTNIAWSPQRGQLASTQQNADITTLQLWQFE